MFHFTAPDIAISASLLLVRIVIAVAFIVASYNKSKHLKKFGKENGLPLPVAGFVMIAEMAGGLGLLFGVLPQYAALGLMLLMLGSLRLHIFVWHSPYWAGKGGWEYDLMLFALASVIIVSGGGAFALWN